MVMKTGLINAVPRVMTSLDATRASRNCPTPVTIPRRKAYSMFPDRSSTTKDYNRIESGDQSVTWLYSLSVSLSKPSRMVNGWGGQPGMYRSTGRIFSIPLRTSGEFMNGPPLMAQAPQATTILGAGIAS